MKLITTVKTKVQLAIAKIITALVAEYHVQKEVVALFKSEIKTNMIDGFRSGKVQAEFKAGVKELTVLSNYKLGFFGQDLENDIMIKTYHDRSKNIVGGNKYGFKRKYRWGSKVVKTQLLRKLGQVHLKPEPVAVEGVNFPPRFKRDMDNKHYLHYKASV